MASGADGLVNEFHVEEGQFVKQGDVLSVLRTVTTDLGIKEAVAELRERQEKLSELEAGSRAEDIAEAKAKMLAVEAVMKNMSNKLERVQRLFAKNAANQDELDDATEKSEGARQTFLATKATYDRVRAGPRKEEIEQARARNEAQREHVAFLEAEKQKRTTKAPFDGYVVKEQTYVGQWLSKGDPVATLARLDEVDVVVNVDQRDLSHVRLGQTTDVFVTGSRRRLWQGKIVQLVPRSDWITGSRGFPVKVRIKNEFEIVDGRRLPVLKEGMMAEVTFLGDPISALMVPKDALVRTSRGTIIFVFDPDQKKSNSGTVRRISVETGISEQATIQVIADGLAPEMQVVTEGAERLQDFQTVQIAEY